MLRDSFCLHQWHLVCSSSSFPVLRTTSAPHPWHLIVTVVLSSVIVDAPEPKVVPLRSPI